MSVTYNPLTDKQIALAVELAKARVEYVRKHGAPLLDNEEEVTLIALRELQDKRKLLKVAERRIAELEAREDSVDSDECYQHLSELYHAQEKWLFKLAQRIKGPRFDKYSHSLSQAIDVLELAIFGESEEPCRAADIGVKEA
ncbi:hypothetical protein ODX81_004103 [Salmonella enterica]|nr:hypothetical protein [Salmonella enterica]